MDIKGAIDHLLEVRCRSAEQIERARQQTYAINLKYLYDDISAIDIAVAALEDAEKSRFVITLSGRLMVGKAAGMAVSIGDGATGSNAVKSFARSVLKEITEVHQ